MIKEVRIKLYKKAIEKWGERSQLEMAQEEATELALACRKFIRNPGEKQYTNLAEEIGDIEVMIEQLKLMNPSIQLSIDRIKEIKLERLKRRLRDGRYESK